MGKLFREASHLIKQLSVVLNKGQKLRSIGVFFVILIGAIFEMLGVSIVIPFIQALIAPESLMNNKYVKPLVSYLNIQNTYELVWLMGGCIILIYIIKNLYLAFALYIQIRFQCNVQKEMSVNLLEEYMKRPYTFFISTGSGDILRGLINDIVGVYTMLNDVFRILAESLTVLMIGIFIFCITDALMTLSIFAMAIGCIILVTFIFKKQLKRYGIQQREFSSEKYKHANQAIGGIKEILVMHREKSFVEEYKNVYEQEIKANIAYTFSASCPEKIIEAICITGLIAMVCTSFSLGMDAVSFIAKLGAFAVAAFRILPSISRIIAYVNAMIYNKPSLDATYQNLLDVKKYEKYLAEYKAQKHSEKSIQDRKDAFKQELDIRNISWHYPDSEVEVLHNFNLKIVKGTSIALIGASGSGKTTVSDIILGLFRPQRGSVYVDDVDIFTISDMWSQVIGYVPQSVYLTDDTIRRNIAFGIKEDEIDDKQVWIALEQAQLKKFVEQLPKGLETVVGERGVKFSGGQRQRIAIARALYYNPDILVLDEATSALDTETETSVMEAIESLQGFKTFIIVAHRLSTIRKCDKIYEVFEGQLVERTKQEVFAEALE